MVSARSGRPTMNPSDRAVSRTPVPLSSMARRAARIRSTASVKSNSGFAASPVESSIERPATPVAVAAATLAATSSGAIAKPPSKSALTGTLDSARDGANVSQGLLQRYLVVAPAQRPGKSGAGGGERGKAELGEQAGAAEVPRIGDDEAAGLVQPAERPAPFGGAGHARATLHQTSNATAAGTANTSRNTGASSATE